MRSQIWGIGSPSWTVLELFAFCCLAFEKSIWFKRLKDRRLQVSLGRTRSSQDLFHPTDPLVDLSSIAKTGHVFIKGLSPGFKVHSDFLWYNFKKFRGVDIIPNRNIEGDQGADRYHRSITSGIRR